MRLSREQVQELRHVINNKLAVVALSIELIKTKDQEQIEMIQDAQDKIKEIAEYLKGLDEKEAA